MKIVFMGTPDFAVPCLRNLAESEYEIAAVFTQPDKPKGRGYKMIPTPVKSASLEYDIPVYQPLSLRKGDDASNALEMLREINPDLIVVVAYGQILPKEILELPKYGCINIHASLLPSYRGAAPIQWSVLNGEKITGVTSMLMAEGLDTGDMLLKREVVIDAKETGASLFDKLMEVGAQLVVEVLPMIENGEIVPEKQEEEKATYVGRLTKAMGLIDFTKDAVVIERLIRGLNSWPSAYTTVNGKTLKIWEADVVSGKEGAKPGEIFSVEKDAFFVAAGKDALRITSVQLEGKKRMAVKDFLLGYPLKAGDFLGKEQ